jgi:maltose O-acetyltransferase
MSSLRSAARKGRGIRKKLNGEVDLEGLVARGLNLGKNVYLAPWCIVDPGCAFMIDIGDNVVFGPRVQVLAHDASMRNAIGMTRFAPVVIESGVFIGADTLVLPGTTIGKGSVIGGGSVVSGKIPSGVLAYGSPARVAGSAESYLERQKLRMDAGLHFTAADRADPGRWRSIREAVGDGEGWWP